MLQKAFRAKDSQYRRSAESGRNTRGTYREDLRLVSWITQKIAEKDYDKNRFEQEMIYYIEKLDVNEEKNRLDNHLKYFIPTMESGHGQGKLGFIALEMGRRINTLDQRATTPRCRRSWSR